MIYGLLVFVGTTGLGFVALPALAYAAGLFAIETEARAAFSLVTLKAAPILVGLCAAVGPSYRSLAGFSIAGRVAVYSATTLVVWVAAAAIAVFILA